MHEEGVLEGVIRPLLLLFADADLLEVYFRGADSCPVAVIVEKRYCRCRVLACRVQFLYLFKARIVQVEQ